jgi:hypothetical protein
LDFKPHTPESQGFSGNWQQFIIQLGNADANFSPFFWSLYLQGFEGDFKYTEKFEVLQAVGK